MLQSLVLGIISFVPIRFELIAYNGNM